MQAINAFEAAMSAYAAGQHDVCENQLQECIKANPNHARGCNGAAYWFITRRDFESALPLLIKAITNDPSLVAAHINMGSLLFMQGNVEKAAASYEKALQQNPVHFESLLYSAICYIQENGDIAKAEELFRSAADVDPDDCITQHMLANLLYRSGRVDESIVAYERAQEAWISRRNNPKPPTTSDLFSAPQDSSALGAGEICNNWGLALRAKRIAETNESGGSGGVGSDIIPDSGGQKINALEVRAPELKTFEKAVALEPTHAWAHCNLGVTCLEIFLRDRIDEVDKLSDAQYHFEYALELSGGEEDSSIREAQNGLALCLMESGVDYEKAEKLLRACTAAHPKWRPAMVNLGRCLAEAGKCDEAVRLLSTALRKKRPDAKLAEHVEYSAALLRADPSAHFSLAMDHMRKGMQADTAAGSPQHAN